MSNKELEVQAALKKINSILTYIILKTSQRKNSSLQCGKLIGR